MRSLHAMMTYDKPVRNVAYYCFVKNLSCRAICVVFNSINIYVVIS